MHVAITGASSGIGKALAEEFSKQGARLTLVARRGELLAELAGRLGQAHVAAWDLSDPARCTGWIAEAEAKHGPIDVFINNAGMENTGLVIHSDPAEGARLLRLNLETPIVLTRHMLQQMIARKSGTVVQMLSVASYCAARGQAWYGASKAGLHMFTEAVRAELGGTGVRILSVHPGPVTTPMAEEAYAKFGGRDKVPFAPEGKPEVLAQRVAAAVKSGQKHLVYPRFYYLSRWFPILSRWITDNQAPMPVTPKG